MPHTVLAGCTCRHLGPCCACFCCKDTALVPCGAGLETLLHTGIELSLFSKQHQYNINSSAGSALPVLAAF